MTPRELLKVGGHSIWWNGDVAWFTAGLTIDADGSPHAYHPEGSPPGLDYLENAGHPGNWWGIVTQKGSPMIQSSGDPAPGFYVSTTSLVRSEFKTADPRRYIDSEKVPFIVVPSPFLKLVKGIVLGCLAKVTYDGKTIDCVVADIGPATHLGEGSIALAKALGIRSNPKTGGVIGGVTYEIHPGVAAPGFELQPLG